MTWQKALSWAEMVPLHTAIANVAETAFCRMCAWELQASISLGREILERCLHKQDVVHGGFRQKNIYPEVSVGSHGNAGFY
jgi:hypothetical protein